MNLPFGLPVIKEVVVRRKEESTEAREQYDRKLAQYRETLENYKNCILEYSGKLDNYERRSLDNQLTIVQTALDMTYIKEQGDKTIELLEDMQEGSMNKMIANLENLATVVLDTNYKLEGLDKNVVNRLSDLLMELKAQALNQNKQLQIELVTGIENMNRNVKKNHTLLWLILVLNFVGINVLVLMVLYIMKTMELF